VSRRPAAAFGVAVIFLAVILGGAALSAQHQEGHPHPERGHEKSPHDATADHPFTGAERWARIFDDPERDEWQKPSEVAEALQMRPGMIVADLGAGTGYFLSYLSKAVGSSGIVLAIDTEPDMLEHLGGRVREAGSSNVVPVLALPADPFLPQGRVDRVLIVDTYHHIDDRLNYFRRMRDALAPDGQVAIVDFFKKPLPVGPPVEHKLARDFVLDEMRAAGWRLAREPEILPYQYFLIFEPAPH
jgi:SAM-dependent methyltransferase